MSVLVSPTVAYLVQPIPSGSVSTSELINPASNRPRRPLLPPDDPREVANKERFGLANVVAHTSAQAGFDLTSLGLNLNTAANIFRTLVSPWNLDEASQAKVAKHEVTVPSSFLLKTANLEPGSSIPTEFKLKPEQIKSFPPETLFYCYYHFPQDTLQLHAAQELHARGWKVHKESKVWMTTSPAGSKDWVFFDPVEWQTKAVTADQGSTDPSHFLPLQRGTK
jgi:NOT2 / NOT3 / NOT5 family